MPTDNNIVCSGTVKRHDQKISGRRERAKCATSLGQRIYYLRICDILFQSHDRMARSNLSSFLRVPSVCMPYASLSFNRKSL